MIFAEEKKQLIKLLKDYDKHLKAERMLRIMPILPWIAEDLNPNDYEEKTCDQLSDDLCNSYTSAFHRHPIACAASAVLTLPLFIVRVVCFDLMPTIAGQANGSKSGRITPIKQLLEIIKEVELIEKKYSNNIFNPDLENTLQDKFKRCKKQIENWTFLSDREERYELLISVVKSIENKIKIIFKNAHSEIKSVYKNSTIIATQMESKASRFFNLPIEINGRIAAFSCENRNYLSGDQLEDIAVKNIKLRAR